jgi:hypothetical protein
MHRMRFEMAIAAGILALGLTAATDAAAGITGLSGNLGQPPPMMSEVDKLRLELMAEINALKAQLAQKVSVADFEAHDHEYTVCNVDYWVDAEGDAHITDGGCHPNHTLAPGESYFDE